MILYKKYQSGGYLQPKKNIQLGAPELTVGKFAQPENVYGMNFHKIPAASVRSTKTRSKYDNKSFADAYKSNFPGTDAVYGTNVGDYYAGTTQENIGTDIVKNPLTPDIKTTYPTGETTTKVGDSEYVNTATGDTMKEADVDNAIFKQFYDTSAHSPRVTEHYRNMFNRLSGATKLK